MLAEVRSDVEPTPDVPPAFDGYPDCELSRLLRDTGLAAEMDFSMMLWLIENFIFDGVYDGPLHRVPRRDREPGEPGTYAPPTFCRTKLGAAQVEFVAFRMHSSYAKHLRIEPDGTVTYDRYPAERCPD